MQRRRSIWDRPPHKFHTAPSLVHHSLCGVIRHFPQPAVLAVEVRSCASSRRLPAAAVALSSHRGSMSGMASPSRVITLLSVLAVALIIFSSDTAEAKVCGSDTDCLTNNAEATCVSGTCKYTCHPNFKDCDHSMENGCESDSLVDEANCGGCGRYCPSPYNAKASCEAGKCAISDSDGDFFIPGRY